MLFFLQVLVGSARNMYNCCVEGMNFEEFFEGETVIFLSVKYLLGYRAYVASPPGHHQA